MTSATRWCLCWMRWIRGDWQSRGRSLVRFYAYRLGPRLRTGWQCRLLYRKAYWQPMLQPGPQSDPSRPISLRLTIQTKSSLHLDYNTSPSSCSPTNKTCPLPSAWPRSENRSTHGNGPAPHARWRLEKQNSVWQWAREREEQRTKR